ncbi:MAG: M48 family metallopeptidase [Deltaproteobacteria bacterium]|nr:M48 family metallopeptidase [Deltaproteobacteria bacterium]
MKNLPSFTIQENPRAKKVILKISPHHGLVVVIPQGFSKKDVPKIINEKKAWIERAFRKIEQRGLKPDKPRELPTSIHLPAIKKDFNFEYAPAPITNLELKQITPSQFRITGDNTNLEGCQYLLKHWLKYQGRVHLIPWLKNLSSETKLNYQRAHIRGQKSRWGSCSGRGNINLNYNLLFLRPELVRYIILHELCHTVHLNHSDQFYSMFGELEPGYQELRAEMKIAWEQLPWWAL